MILWRISNHANLDGTGGLRAGGRWHTRGRRIVYCATSPAAALLEVLVHLELEPASLPLRYRLIKIDALDDLAREHVSAAELASDRTERPELTRQRGDDWLQRGESPLPQVPSALIPETWNVLINPQHADAVCIRLVESSHHPLDQRLAGRYAVGS